MTPQTCSLTIGALAKACNVSTPTIRYYEKIDLMPKADRNRSDQRRYSVGDVQRLTFIRRSRAFGFSIQQVRSLLAVPDGSAADCNVSQAIAQDHIEGIRAKIADLRALENQLMGVIGACQNTCGDQENIICGAFSEMQTSLT